ncbi:MAG: hypothetical protein HYT71_03215 [Candidatus Aenigmarchaeota archaeon]|nr:hypothetical protein [Candidatus Aenigmarchaeota archaeon]
MSVTGKITGLTMIVAGFTFFAWFVALNTISPSIPEGLQGTSRLFMILSAVTGLGFLISGGLSVFGHEENVGQQKNPANVYKPLPKPLFSRPSASQNKQAEDEEDVAIEVGEEKKTVDPEENKKKKEGWEAPSKTGWG